MHENIPNKFEKPLRCNLACAKAGKNVLLVLSIILVISLNVFTQDGPNRTKNVPEGKAAFEKIAEYLSARHRTVGAPSMVSEAAARMRFGLWFKRTANGEIVGTQYRSLFWREYSSRD